MKRSANDLFGFKIRTGDDEIGTVHDFFTDDAIWKIRYLVVSTGGLLGGKKVLISPAVISGVPDWINKFIPVRLNRDQVKHAPDVDLAEPITHTEEKVLADYYGWSTGASEPAREPARPVENYALRSARELMKYHIRTLEDKAGTIRDVIFDEENWTVSYLEARTGGLLSGRTILISPEWVSRVNMPESEVDLRIHQQVVDGAPAYDPSQPLTPDVEQQISHYWSGHA